MNEFAFTNHMMNIGETKGGIVDEEIRKKNPTVMVELGAYTGYSAREVADKESHYYSFEFSPVYAARVREIVDIAGLSDQVTVYEGPFSEQYDVLRGKQVDMYFIDHDKSVYLADLKLILSSGTLIPGSLVAADNVVMPGAPDYLKFIESSSQFSEVRHTVHIKRENMYFIDHDKKVYLQDLKLILDSETLISGSVVVADNVGLVPISGKNEYIEFIENNSQFSEVRHNVYMKREDTIVPDLSVATFLG
ncbi:hypothetical protein PHMEG_00033792 [Phytophthora megakarya]|uniref:catechol O-methyltransferase n=1 Tax=Phytophthora megakarya TaxID=4795 RepID=A0A225USJ3_9STRA|nr:hypothetical protein PHMEG_00033792 [Phytophthora megakarya]